MSDINRARDALHACNPSCGRDEWVELAMAAKAAGLNLKTFDQWSSQADNYNERDTAAVWQSIKRDTGISERTLFKAAHDAGWRPERNGNANRAARPAERTKPPHPSASAADVWARCRPATAAHPYIERKQGTADGLRVVPEGDPLTITGESMAGALVVPVRALGGGDPVSLQFIADRKLNLPGAPMAGVFIVGELHAGCAAFLSEGIGQAWACWKATGHAAVVCFGWGRVRGVAADLRKRDASMRLVLVPDAGKESDAEAIARDVGGLLVKMPEGSPNNFDANDYALREGHDALEVLLADAKRPTTPEPARFKLLSVADLHAMPRMRWLIQSVLAETGVGAIFGPSTSGKSFLALDMTAALAERREWFGHRIKKADARIVVIVLEGEAGFRLRVEAWEKANGRAFPAGVRFVFGAFGLNDRNDVLALAASIDEAGGADLIAIDTLNRATPGADENSAKDMSVTLEGCAELQRTTGGFVLLVHHQGKDASKGMRGHSSLFAAMDCVIEVNRTDAQRGWTVAKAKDGRDGEHHAFRLEIVELGHDEDGEQVTSCVVRLDHAPVARSPKPPKGGNERIVYDALGPLLRKSGHFGKAGAPAQRPCIKLDDAIDGVRDRLTVEPKRRSERTRQALTSLVASGVLGSNEGWLWLN